MLDPRLFRNDLDQVVLQLKNRGFNLDVETFSRLETERKRIQICTQTLQNERNMRSKSIGQAKAKGEDIRPLLEAVENLGDDLKLAETNLTEIQAQLENLLLGVPNILDNDVPVGLSEENNTEVYRWGEIPDFSFTPKDHVDLGTGLGQMDFETGAKLAGSRFVTLKGSLARLQRALIQFMLDIHTSDHGYDEMYVPYLANTASLRGTGQLPKFEEDLFAVSTDPLFYLIPTAEVPITNLVRDEIVEADNLPLKFVCHTPCFRSEAGSYGKDVRGMIRQHQFEKVELVQMVKPEESNTALDSLTANAEEILKSLKLPYRKVLLCSGDTGFSSAKTFDLEVWLPGQNNYREISSCSNFRDFQARRLKARWRNPDTKKPELLNTLNGSGVAAGRALIAVLENYQDENGRIAIPEVLKPYMGGKTIIDGS